MIVTCEDCGATFNFNESLIKPGGSKVRCSKCKRIFTVLPPTTAPSADTAAEAPDTGAAPSGKISDEGDEALAELDSKLDDIFGEEGDTSSMADIGEMTDLDIESAELADDSPGDAGDAEFTLDLDSDDADELLTELDAEELDLSDVEDLDVSAAAGEAVSDSDDDLELGLDLLSEDDSAADLADDELPQIDDLLDLSAEEIDAESGSPDPADSEAEGIQDTPDDELEAALDMVDVEDTIEAPVDASEGTADGFLDVSAEDQDVDEIDLSDIEEMLSGDDVDLGGDSSLEADGADDTGADEQLDLSDFAREPAEDDGTAAVELAADDLELDLDLGDEIVPETAAPAADDSSDELDFTDLADMLEPDDTPASEAESGDDSLDLELDLAETDGAAADAAPDAEGLDLDSMLDGAEVAGTEEELDLTLELDGLPDDTPADAAAQPELEFDLEADLGEPGEDFSHEDELELNLLDDEPALETADVATQALPDDIGEATGGLAADAQEIGATTDDFATEEFTDARDLTADGDLMTADDTAVPPLTARPKRGRKTLVAVLAGFVLIISALIVPNLLGIHVPVLSDIKIPFINDWIGDSGKADAGNLKVIPLGKTINAKFVDNQTAGRLLVVSGQVRNEYEHARSFIQIAGKLFGQDGTLARSATVYAGNMISTLDLARLDLTKIKDQLQNKAGQRKSNLNVKKGRVVPFMIVFDQLPDGLDEYTVEVVGSARKK